MSPTGALIIKLPIVLPQHQNFEKKSKELGNKLDKTKQTPEKSIRPSKRQNDIIEISELYEITIGMYVDQSQTCIKSK